VVVTLDSVALVDTTNSYIVHISLYKENGQKLASDHFCNILGITLYYIVNMNELNDEQIAHLIQTGNAELFGELIERYEDKLKRYARKFLNTNEDIEDLVQDIFIKSYTNIQSFDKNLRFSPWIYRIAHNTFVNELKRKSLFNFGMFDVDAILPQLPAKETTDASILSAELQEEMESLLSELPNKYREVIVLYYFEELSYQEISEVLQIPVTTVGVRISRARKKLRSYYDQSEKLKEKTI